MAGEVTIPLLPCPSIDEVAGFYEMLGFAVTSRQTKPNPYVVVQREDLQLHFAGIPGFDPEQSYGSCLVIVPDVAALHRAFADGMRAVHGKVLVSGIPRMTRPRLRKNTGRHSGFSVVDPGGNWIRIFQSSPDEAADDGEPIGRLAATLGQAIVLGDSKGDARQAARVLDATLARHGGTALPVDRVAALVYRAELAVRLGDDERARVLLSEVADVPLTDAERERLADALANADDLAEALSPGVRPTA